MTEDEIVAVTEDLADLSMSKTGDVRQAVVALIDAAAVLTVCANLDHGIVQMGLDNALQSAHESLRDYKKG